MVEHLSQELIPRFWLLKDLDDTERLLDEPVCIHMALEFIGENSTDIERLALLRFPD